MSITVEQQLQKNYLFLEVIGNGSFGQILKIASKSTSQIYACKVEKSHGKSFILVQKQYHILNELLPTKLFPDVFQFKRLEKNSYLVMELMGKNLEELLVQNGRNLSPKTVALIADQVIRALEVMHENGFLHRDLKPQNIMTSLHSHAIKLVDFGLADAIDAPRVKNIIGNVRFASRRSHLGFSSPKDDLEGLINVLYYLLTGSLPWKDSTKEEIEKEILRKVNDEAFQLTPILAKKRIFRDNLSYPATKNQATMCYYDEFTELVRNVYDTPEKSKPNYKKMLHQCARLMAISGTERGACFDWCPKNCPHWKSLQDLWRVYK